MSKTQTTYGYDANGNLASQTVDGAVTSYTWDEENRLTHINYPNGASESYLYDGQGLRQPAS
jgi:YD repeat-containing protein